MNPAHHDQSNLSAMTRATHREPGRLFTNSRGSIRLLPVIVVGIILGWSGVSLAGDETQGVGAQGWGTQGWGTQGWGTQGWGLLATSVPEQKASAESSAAAQAQRPGPEAVDEREGAVETARSEQVFVTGTPWDSMGMTGPMFTGIIPARENRQQLVLHVVRFRGDQVDALVRDGVSGWRDQTLHARSLVELEWLEYRCDIAPHCPARQYRIVAARQDGSRSTMPAYPDNRDVWLYRVQARPLDGHSATEWREVCAVGRQSTGDGLFVDGQWRRDGGWSLGGYTFSCTSGVIAKCARRWGYKPWRTLMASDGRAVPLRPLHLACIRAARADYCGNGISYTRNGTLIDIRDIYGFNVAVSIDGFSEESGFDSHGALFVARERWPTRTQDDQSVISLPTCRRPRSSLDRESERVLLSVWSAEHSQ